MEIKVIRQGYATRARIPPGLAGKIEKSGPLPGPIRLQDSQNSARSRIEKKIYKVMYFGSNFHL